MSLRQRDLEQDTPAGTCFADRWNSGCTGREGRGRSAAKKYDVVIDLQLFDADASAQDYLVKRGHRRREAGGRRALIELYKGRLLDPFIIAQVRESVEEPGFLRAGAASWGQ